MLNISASRRGLKNESELNIAPLIDIVFILLIFFLVNTSFVKETGVKISRPGAKTASNAKKESILIAVTEKNTIHMNNKKTDLNTMEINLERELTENPDAGVIILADKNSRTGIVISIMDQCRLAGAYNISVAANRPE